MATFKYIFFALTVLVATSNAAPKKLNLRIPDECIGKGFCNIKPEGYDEMQKIVTDLLTDKFIAQNIGDRIGVEDRHEVLSPESDWHNCPYRKTVESSYAYSHYNGSETDYIIQHELLNQPIEVITCARDKIESGPEEECFQHLGLKAFNMKSTCQSSTAKRSLLVLDLKTHQIKKKSYDVPCCCSCHINNSI